VTVRVVGVDEFGGPEMLRVFDVPEKHPRLGEVRIAVKAAAVNPTDTFTRNGARAEMLKAFPPPYVPGMDVAGVIDEVGDGVSDFEVGDRVMAIVVPRGSHGGYSESIVLPVQSVAPAPAGASFAEAASLPMNGLTARLALDLLALSPGQTIAVTGAAGAFGGYVVQLAKADGLRVIADASVADEDLVRALGADIVVRRGPEVASNILEHASHGVDGLADGSVQCEQIVAAVRDGGGIATVRGWADSVGRGITVHPVWVREYAHEQTKLDGLRRLVEDGSVTLRIAQEFTAEQAGEAHRILQAGGTRGRLIITF
jgi:NADPH:quinone reductase